MSGTRPVLMLAGGTGGHIFPGLAVAAALREQAMAVVWLGAVNGLETKLVPEAGIECLTIPVAGLRRRGWRNWLAAPWALTRALIAAWRAVRQVQPRAALAFGGFAAGPGGLAAWLLGVPLVVHEQNRIAGLTNRVLARLARCVLTGFADVRIGPRDTRWVGNPVRAAITELPAPDQRALARAGDPTLRLLVIGGSQGARALNEAMPQALAPFPARGAPPIEVRHQCGPALLDATTSAYAHAGVAARIEPFIADMAQAWAWADLVVCRAGALTLAEVCAAGVASVLVPYPYAVDDHQTLNAQALVGAGAALLVTEGADLAAELRAAIETLAADPGARLTMARAARALARPDAANRIAQIVLEVSRP